MTHYKRSIFATTASYGAIAIMMLGASPALAQDAPPADASSPDAQTPGMLPLVCCRSRAAARRVATRRPRCATRRAPLTAATATPLTAMLSPPPPSLAAITADLTFSSASTTATSFAAVVVTAAC